MTWSETSKTLQKPESLTYHNSVQSHFLMGSGSSSIPKYQIFYKVGVKNQIFYKMKLKKITGIKKKTFLFWGDLLKYNN